MKTEKEVIIKHVEKHYIDTIYEGLADGLPEGMRVVYRDAYWTSKEDGVHHIEPTIHIGTTFSEYFTMHPSLDACLKIEHDIVYCTSDGKLEIFDTKTRKGTTVPIGIVPFGDYTNIKITDKYIIVSGIGCYWGCESEEQYFEIKLTRKNLICIKNKIEDYN